jgi:vacuolar protein sorting-associated protein 54
VYTAISTLIQPPIVRTGLIPHTAASTSGYKPPSSKDIPPVTLTNIPHVESKAFQQYLSQVGSLYDAFQRAKQGGWEDGDSQLLRGEKLGLKVDESDPLKVPVPQERRYSSISGSPSSISSFDARDRKRTSGTRGRGPQTVTPLSTIPSVYFEEDFHLENPRTFDVVSERSEVLPPPPKPPMRDGLVADGMTVETFNSGRRALATNAILQEKLSWYMDTVEIHLVTSISTASKSFFTALGSLRELHAEAADSVKRIQTLRKDLNKVDKEMALGGLKVVNLRRRRENVRRLANAVAQLHDVVASVSECEEMVEKGDIEDAMDGLDDVERLMAGEESSRWRAAVSHEEGELRPIIDLRSVKALEGASDNLKQLRTRIGMAYETRFLDDLLSDLRRHVESVPPLTTLQRWGLAFQRTRGSHRLTASISPTYMVFDSQLRSRLHVDLTGLGRAHHTMPAATAFKTAILREMKGLIRRHLPSSSDDDSESTLSASTLGGRQLSQQEKSTILARNLRALDAGDAYGMLTKVYTGVSEALRRLSIQVKILLDIASGQGVQPSSAGMRSSPRSPSMQNLDDTPKPSIKGRATEDSVAQDEILQVLDMSNLLGQAVDIVQSQINKVLKVRSEQAPHLALDDFLKYFTLNRLFADECEAISGRSGTALKTVVDNQIREFISQFGDSQRRGIVEIMDSDKWDARDFGDSENEILSRIIQASTKDVDSWLQVSKIWIHGGEVSRDKGSLNGTAANGSGRDKVRSAVVDEQRFILSESAVAIMKSIEELEYLMTNIPSMAQEVGSNLLECLKLFNSRSSQLILGAGATRSAGLKNITTKHLALSSQALSFIVALIPYVREFVRRYSSSPPLMVEFDKVKRLYQEHQNGIHEKLVDIMGARASVHVAAMKKINWDAEKDTATVSPYMETLTKETGTLQRVLAKHLPEMTVMMVMNPVFTSYRDQWTKAFQEVTVRSELGRQR